MDQGFGEAERSMLHAIFEQTVRNSEGLHVLNGTVSKLAGDVAEIKVTLRSVDRRLGRLETRVEALEVQRR